jgi:ferredoxin
MADDLAEIDRDECVECYNCFRSEICPVEAIEPEELDWPRSLRRALSDPQTIDDKTGISGRGTAEMKTNDITDRIKPGFVGFGIELGRPNMGTRFSDVEKVARAIAPCGISFEDENPVTSLMTDKLAGTLREDILEEKALTAILEGIMPADKLDGFLDALEKISGEINTVMSVGLSSRFHEDGSLAFEKVLKARGMAASTNGKVNIGLGRG